jgi:hypothetical protein
MVPKFDPALFSKKVDGEILIFQLYMNDIIFGSTNKKINVKFSNLMTDKFEMSMMGELKSILGFEVNQSKEGNLTN